jgi:3-dehydroquinate dehydratase II
LILINTKHPNHFPRHARKFTPTRTFSHRTFTRHTPTITTPALTATPAIALSIVIIQGPHASRPANAELPSKLQQLASAAGQTLEWLPCSGLRDLVEHVRSMKRRTSAFMLLDPGDLGPQALAHPEAGLCDALDETDTPYIEVHDDADSELGIQTGLHHAPMATVIINGDLSSSYRIGLGIALRQLGNDALAVRAA